jgi:hypothetical protein
MYRHFRRCQRTGSWRTNVRASHIGERLEGTAFVLILDLGDLPVGFCHVGEYLSLRYLGEVRAPHNGKLELALVQPVARETVSTFQKCGLVCSSMLKRM